jgi:hypothetical protein
MSHSCPRCLSCQARARAVKPDPMMQVLITIALFRIEVIWFVVRPVYSLRLKSFINLPIVIHNINKVLVDYLCKLKILPIRSE